MTPSPEIIQALLSGDFKVTRRPVPVAGDLRINSGIAIVVMILGRSRQKKASYQKLHFLAHAVRTPEMRKHALALLQADRSRLLPLIRVEPWVNRAVNLASALELTGVHRGSVVELLPKGVELFEALTREGDTMRDEWEFISRAAVLASEKKVTSIMNMDYLIWA